MTTTTNLKIVNVIGNENDDVLAATAPRANGIFDTLQINVTGLGGNDVLTASNGPNNWKNFATLNATSEMHVSNALFGGEGQDTLIDANGFAGLSPDLAGRYSVVTTLTGGDGDDTYVLRSTNTTLVETDGANSGHDTVVLSEAFYAQSHSFFSEFVLSDAAYANIENVRLSGSQNFTTVLGSQADNEITGNVASNFLHGMDGNDKVSGAGGADTLYGDDGHDSLFGGTGDDDLYGGEGDNLVAGSDGVDNLYAGTGNDTMYGGAGSDAIDAGDGDNLMTGGEGDDHFTGGAGNDTATGGTGSDHFDLGDGANTATGGQGTDFFHSVSGSDSLSGGQDNDSYQLDSAILATVYEAEDSGYDSVVSLQTSLDAADFANVEELEVGQSPDGTDLDLDITGGGAVTYMIGNGGNNHIDGSTQTLAQILEGNGGDDTLTGGSANDMVNGGKGNDHLLQSGGFDVLLGGEGNDSYTLSMGASAVEEMADEGFDTVITADFSLNAADYANFEAFTLTGSADLDIRADADGVMGSFRMTGNDGNNLIIGGHGVDTLVGGAGNDTIIGGAADTSLDQPMADISIGGEGADTFVFDLYNDTSASGTVMETIGDFQVGIDVIDLSSFGAMTEASAETGFTGGESQYMIETFFSDTTLYIDSNGDGAADLMISFAPDADFNGVALTSADLIFSSGSGAVLL